MDTHYFQLFITLKALIKSVIWNIPAKWQWTLNKSINASSILKKNFSPFLLASVFAHRLSENLISIVTSFYLYPFIIGLFLIVIILIFMIRERRIKLLYNKLKNELQERVEKIELQEKKILTQKEEIDAQLVYSQEQKDLIHQQTSELEKHRQQLEKIVGARTSELKIAKEKAEESDRLKTAFLQNMSHEIRTPMNAIIGFASLLSQPSLSNEEKEKFISRITKNSNLLLRLIEDIIDISKINTDQLELLKSKFSVDKALKSLFTQFKTEKDELRLDKVDFILDENKTGHEHFLYTDKYRFDQVLSNFLSNAFKYTEKGVINFGYKTVFNSEYDKEPSMLHFYVCDTGIGIPPEKTEYIFDIFNKIEDDSSKLYRGAGLGLFISKGLISLMGGQIGVQSKLQEGSCFYFNLPYFDLGDVQKKNQKKRK